MDFDALVIGGGHAGIEAALALARLDYSTLFITQSLDTVGRMSCNPAVGGLSKGNMVREIDALGGQMARLIDASMIQFRMLNRSRGPAVQSPRAQADKPLYSLLAKHTLELQKGLSLFQDTVIDLLLSSDGRRIEGVVTERRRRISARTVVLTTGTFMEASIFIGDFSQSSGRLGEPAAVGLGHALRRLGFTVGRLKTGTPARVLRSSVDFSRLEEQPGDTSVVPFSFGCEEVNRPSVPCYITYTNDRTHEIIRNNIHRSPLYGGVIRGVGPRYCPSIEDKVVRFPDRDRHQIFIEPEGLNTEEMYLNGISSSLPEEVQEEFLHTIEGLDDVVIMRPGYAVEYDYIDPRQLYPNLECKFIEGLFVAGQTNGTSGYEEAAGQGLLAGINAANRLAGREPLILGRDEAYIGVLIDDLVTLGTREPYRMFTSRAEYRLCLRHDSADMRLAEKAAGTGLLSKEMRERLEAKRRGLEEIKELLASRRITSEDEEKLPEEYRGVKGKLLEQALKDPAYDPNLLLSLDSRLTVYRPDWLEQAVLDVKYEGYIRRQERQISRFRKMEGVKIPADFDYRRAEGLSVEAREKLETVRPLSLGQASRISGVRNSDIAVLMMQLRGGKNARED
jgi:tRNA uridine 5-carboxymethylaminomethyl modification enzyme